MLTQSQTEDIFFAEDFRDFFTQDIGWDISLINGDSALLFNEIKEFCEFLVSSKKGIFLRGSEGSGKTSTLYHSFNYLEKRDGIKVFYVDLAKINRKLSDITEIKDLLDSDESLRFLSTFNRKIQAILLIDNLDSVELSQYIYVLNAIDKLLPESAIKCLISIRNQLPESLEYYKHQYFLAEIEPLKLSTVFGLMSRTDYSVVSKLIQQKDSLFKLALNPLDCNILIQLYKLGALKSDFEFFEEVSTQDLRSKYLSRKIGDHELASLYFLLKEAPDLYSPNFLLVTDNSAALRRVSRFFLWFLLVSTLVCTYLITQSLSIFQKSSFLFELTIGFVLDKINPLYKNAIDVYISLPLGGRIALSMLFAVIIIGFTALFIHGFWTELKAILNNIKRSSKRDSTYVSFVLPANLFFCVVLGVKSFIFAYLLPFWPSLFLVALKNVSEIKSTLQDFFWIDGSPIASFLSYMFMAMIVAGFFSGKMVKVFVGSVTSIVMYLGMRVLPFLIILAYSFPIFIFAISIIVVLIITNGARGSTQVYNYKVRAIGWLQFCFGYIFDNSDLIFGGRKKIFLQHQEHSPSRPVLFASILAIAISTGVLLIASGDNFLPAISTSLLACAFVICTGEIASSSSGRLQIFYSLPILFAILLLALSGFVFNVLFGVVLNVELIAFLILLFFLIFDFYSEDCLAYIATAKPRAELQLHLEKFRTELKEKVVFKYEWEKSSGLLKLFLEPPDFIGKTQASVLSFLRKVLVEVDFSVLEAQKLEDELEKKYGRVDDLIVLIRRKVSKSLVKQEIANYDAYKKLGMSNSCYQSSIRLSKLAPNSYLPYFLQAESRKVRSAKDSVDALSDLEKSLQRARLWKDHILLLDKIKSRIEFFAKKFQFSEQVVSNLCEAYMNIIIPRLQNATIDTSNVRQIKKMVSQARQLNKLRAHDIKYTQIIEKLEKRISEVSISR